MRRSVYPRPKTNFKPARCDGSIQWTVGLFFLTFLLMILCADLQVCSFRATGLYMEDALAASNLASAIIDVEEYGISHNVWITDVENAYRIYRQALNANMESTLIQGPITVEKYIIYNVSKDEVAIHTVTAEGRTYTTRGNPGEVRAPNGQLVENTGVYSEISFPVKGLWGIQVTAHKSKLVDIVSTLESAEGSISE